MNLPGRLLVGLGLPLAFAATVLALAWVLFDGPGALWNVVLGIACVVVGGVICFYFWEFLTDYGDEHFGPLVASLAALALVIAGLIGANQWILHERGRDIACRVTSITERSGDDSTWYEYALACDGGAPSAITNSVRYSDIKEGQRVVVRYDPVGHAVPTLSRETSDGHTALTAAAIALGVLLLLGLLISLTD